MPQMKMAYDEDPAKVLLDKLGDLSGLDVFNNQILVAIHVRPTKTKSGLYLTETHIDEDRYQGKVGLLVKMGPQAFVSDGKWFVDADFKVGQWLVLRQSDAWSVTIQGTLCKLLDDINVRGRVADPDMVF